MRLLSFSFVGILAFVSAASAEVTFDDITPLLQKHCLECHRPGQIAPMSFLTYEETRPWAESIKENVASRAMPPWHAACDRGAVLLEAGHFGQTFCLVATWLGLAPFETAALADSLIEKDLGIDGVRESVLCAAGVGPRPKEVSFPASVDGEPPPLLVRRGRLPRGL